MMAEAPEAEAAATKHAYESLSESDDEPDEVTRLRVTRPNILKDEHKNVYKGRQVMSNFFDILEQAERDEIEEANQPPPKYYWSEGVRSLVVDRCVVLVCPSFSIIMQRT